jgi:ABC-2 type transport system permease protein
VIGALVGRNLRHQRGLLLALVLGLMGFEVLLVFAAAQIESGLGFRSLVEMLPQALRDALASQLSLASFAAAVALGFQHPFAVAATVAFVVLAASVPAAERESGLLDLILARPAHRARYLFASLLCVVLGAVILPLALLGGAAVGLALVQQPGELAWTRYVPSAGGLVALLLAVGGYTLLLASGAARRGPPVARAVGLTLVMYVVEFLADVWPRLEWIRWTSPFHYFKPIASAVVPSTPVIDPLVLLGAFGVTTLAAFVRFQRRDI